jgi:NitT/TauT family transport system substrate-binding protein
MLGGEVEIASVAETPIVFASLGRDDFSIIATTSAFDDYPKIVGLKSRGIRTAADLRGKRVATQKGSAIQFFLHVFMAKNGLTRKDVQVLFIPQEELVDALAAGKIDAFAMREPHVARARSKLGDDVTVLAAPGLYTMTTNLTASKKFIGERPEVIKRALRALIRAERYAVEQPEEVIGIVSKRTGIARAEVASLLANAKIGLALDQALLFTLEEEARWAIDNKLTPAVALPNYLNYVYPGALQSLKPSAVTLIR